jgi:hypothetical protein
MLVKRRCERKEKRSLTNLESWCMSHPTWITMRDFRGFFIEIRHNPESESQCDVSVRITYLAYDLPPADLQPHVLGARISEDSQYPELLWINFTQSAQQSPYSQHPWIIVNHLNPPQCDTDIEKICFYDPNHSTAYPHLPMFTWLLIRQNPEALFSQIVRMQEPKKNWISMYMGCDGFVWESFAAPTHYYPKIDKCMFFAVMQTELAKYVANHPFPTANRIKSAKNK